MSCNEDEHGTIKIPSAAYGKLKAAVMEAYNEGRQALFKLATEIQPKLLAAGKGKRGFDYRKELSREDGDYRKVYFPRSREDDDGDVEWEVARLLFPSRTIPHPTIPNMTTQSEPPKKPGKPKKKDLELATRKTTSYSCSDGRITFRDKERAVVWDVSENNHACEHARKHPVARAFFQALGRIEWTRGSGGTIYGNDEYNRDAGQGHEGGGGNYVTASYGPKTAAEKKTEAASRFSSFGDYRRY